MLLALVGLGVVLVATGIALTFGSKRASSQTASASTSDTAGKEETGQAAEVAPVTTAAAELVSAQIIRPTLTPPRTGTMTAGHRPPTAVPSSTPQASPTPTPAGPADLNGIPIHVIAVMPDAVRAHVREIAAAGQTLGRNPHAFSKLGDSTILNPHFMGPFDGGNYNLGDFAYLQPTIEFFRGSFARHGVAARHGLHSWSVFDPLWADPEWCLPNEAVLACELRLNNPGVLFVRLGSNDAGAPSGFRKHVRDVVRYSIENGVIPILGTKADRFEGDNTNNDILREIAAEFDVPLWEFDLVAGTIPGRGLAEDNVHLIQTADAHDFTTPEAFQRGHAMQDLTALLALDAVRREIETMGIEQ
jgi:hypothetical protein